LELIAALSNDAKHYTNRVGAIHTCALVVPHIYTCVSSK